MGQRKRQKIFGSLIFCGGIEMKCEHVIIVLITKMLSNVLSKSDHIYSKALLYEKYW